MPIEELKEPYWDKQQGETPNQYCYFLEFLKFPTNNLREFHDCLCEEGKKRQKEAKVPTYKTIRKWAAESCNNWVFRKAAKRKAEDDDIQDILHELDKEDRIDNFKSKNRLKKELLKRMELEVYMQPLSQIRQGIDGYVSLANDNRVDQGEATEYTNTKLDADIDAKTENKTQIELEFQQAYDDLIETTKQNSLHITDGE